jgi:hypothetical protein
MSFDSTNGFGSGPLNEAALAAAKDLYNRLQECPAGTLDHIYNHWTVGHEGQDFPDYNVSVRYANGHFYLDITHNPQDNARGVNNNAPADHTWLRNTGGVGIATDDMVFATTTNFGDEGVTKLALEYMCAANATVAKKYGIDLGGKTPASAGQYASELPIMTHAVAAMTGGNPPPSDYYNYGLSYTDANGNLVKGTVERWDHATWIPVPSGETLTAEDAQKNNYVLIERSKQYKVALG